MKLLSTVITVSLLFFMPARRSENTMLTAKATLNDFITKDVNGARLFAEGWHEVAPYFLRPGPQPSVDTIFVVSDTFELKEGEANATRAQFHVFFPHAYGQLDKLARFRPRPNRAMNGALIKDGILMSYTLVIAQVGRNTNEHSCEGNEPGLGDWKIENPPGAPAISIESAIRYVTQIRDQTKDTRVKKYAQESLAQLRTLDSSTR